MTLLELANELAADVESLKDTQGEYLPVSGPHIVKRHPNGNVAAAVFTLALEGQMISVSVEHI